MRLWPKTSINVFTANVSHRATSNEIAERCPVLESRKILKPNEKMLWVTAFNLRASQAASGVLKITILHDL